MVHPNVHLLLEGPLRLRRVTTDQKRSYVTAKLRDVQDRAALFIRTLHSTAVLCVFSVEHRSLAAVREHLKGYQEVYGFCFRHALLLCRLADSSSTAAAAAGDAETGKRPPLLIVEALRWAPGASAKCKEDSKGGKSLLVSDGRKDSPQFKLKARSTDEATQWLRGTTLNYKGCVLEGALTG